MSPLEALSFQLYSARALEPLEAKFELLAGLGYRKVEPYAALFAEADRLKELLTRHGMTAPTAHLGLDRLRDDARAALKLCRDLGVETVFAPAPPLGEREQDEEGWKRLGQELARFGKIAADEGLKFGWHNHHWEFARAKDGRLYLDVMFDEAPDLLWQADLAWIIRGGCDPVAELKKRKGRAVSAHVKDLAPQGEAVDEGGWADVGHGVMDWPALLPAMKDAGVKTFVAEHDRPSDVARFARRARDTIASWR